MPADVSSLIAATRAGFLGLIMLVAPSWAAAELPDDSVYHIESFWLNQNGDRSNIAELQGKVQVVAFVYTYCEHSCPLIISSLKQIEKRIPAKKISGVQFLLISLDPARDSPEVLKRYMIDHDLNEQLWTMLNGDPDDVLELSALMGVRYRPMNNDADDIAHSNMITVLDQRGRIQYKMKGLNEDLEAVVAAISRATSAGN